MILLVGELAAQAQGLRDRPHDEVINDYMVRSGLLELHPLATKPGGLNYCP